MLLFFSKIINSTKRSPLSLFPLPFSLVYHTHTQTQSTLCVWRSLEFSSCWPYLCVCSICPPTGIENRRLIVLCPTKPKFEFTNCSPIHLSVCVRECAYVCAACMCVDQDMYVPFLRICCRSSALYSGHTAESLNGLRTLKREGNKKQKNMLRSESFHVTTICSSKVIHI